MTPLLRTLALAGLLLLPIQVRAGAASPHPHALLHLLLDASDGELDHHTVDDAAAAATGHHARDIDATGFHQPDVPTHGTFITATAGLAVLTLVSVLAIPAPRAGHTWPPCAWWRERRPLLEPPPPRVGCV